MTEHRVPVPVPDGAPCRKILKAWQPSFHLATCFFGFGSDPGSPFRLRLALSFGFLSVLSVLLVLSVTIPHLPKANQPFDLFGFLVPKGDHFGFLGPGDKLRFVYSNDD